MPIKVDIAFPTKEELNPLPRDTQKKCLSSYGLWIPEAKARCKTKRRKADLEITYNLWNKLPLEIANKTSNKEDVLLNIAKKYDKVLNCHKLCWHH